MKKNIEIQCITKNCCIPCYYYIFVYYKKRIIYKGFTNSYGYIQFKIPRCRTYTIVILGNMINFQLYAKTQIFINKYLNKPFLFIFEHNSSIYIKVTDKFYKGLPIAKGELKLCQNNM